MSHADLRVLSDIAIKQRRLIERCRFDCLICRIIEMVNHALKALVTRPRERFGVGKS